ncbi:NADPH-dependent glutamate synthase [Alkalicella caledoniensis]|uniref:NADPH-dependent glutamate synthase n=1 Tax=Alkalicella caledoniensis TaxID=2731377 RepID=A0A7G9WBU6_ALKCA|nr:NADPH-dependent glutamate synthase [Alkalicella caledoniensis]QNO16158.1 NADPH-dependent glutamate synthase [Alkalicella caledoniensis]
MAGTKKNPMPCQPGEERVKNFLEVALGYDEDVAINEAKRCIQCKNPKCVSGCPVGIEIPKFIEKIAEGDFQGAIDTLKEKNSLPAICGRVCPQEEQCEKVCIVGIKNEPVGIGRLERFAADWERKNRKEQSKISNTEGKKVAIVGSGPAGLTCAGELAKMGYQVTIFEAFHQAGGVLMYGIPEFRLPKEIVQEEINALLNLGVELKTNVVIGQTITIKELMEEEGYEAVFVGSGAGLPYFLNIPGENLNGVYSANEFLTRVNLMRAYLHPQWDTPVKVGKKVAVVGAGNVAMDAARTAKRLGAEDVYIVYRRSEDEMPARIEEIHHAKEEGIDFRLLTNPMEVLGNSEGWVTGLKCLKMELGEPDSSGRRRPVPIENSEFELDVDVVIIAIGQGPNPLIPRSTPELQTSKWGNITADESTGNTSMEGVFAGGDVVTGAATVIKAMGAGKNAAVAMDQYIKNK